MMQCFYFLFAAMFSTLVYCCQQNRRPTTGATWQQYKVSNGNLQYSSLAQIDAGNVQQLQATRKYRTGDADTASASQIQCNPIVVDGTLYGSVRTEGKAVRGDCLRRQDENKTR